MADRILILGASARAAAASARRAGLTPFAVDLFADADTERICEKVWRCPPDRYPDGLFELAKQAPPMPWMYTGGLENYPELVGALARERELWGNGPEVLKCLRDPFALSAVLSGKGFDHAQPLSAGRPPVGTQWLQKPIAGSGGGGIRFAVADDFAEPTSAVYFQEFVAGRSMSCLYASRHPRCALLGMSAQLVDTPWLHASDFRYAGSIGPVTPSDNVASHLRLLGYRLLIETRASGVWGVDFVLADASPCVVEVNPRYPASAEIYEHATGRPMLAAGLEDSTRPTNVVGKAVYYAPLPITFPASGPWDDSLARAADVWHRPDYADLPHPGDVIEPGQPVLTILAEAATEDDCLARLRSRSADLDRLFGHTPENPP